MSVISEVESGELFKLRVLPFPTKSRLPKVMFSVDIETLSTSKVAVVVSIGIAAFTTEKVLDSRHILIDWDSQVTGLGRMISPDTLRFWFKQDEQVRNQTFVEGKREEADEALKTLDAYIRAYKHTLLEDRTMVWVKGPHFDAAILETLAEDFDHKSIIKYGDWVDVRTINRLSGYEAPPFDGAHNAEIDAVEQAKQVIKGFELLGLN